MRLAAAAARGQHLLRVGAAVGVERVAQPGLRVEVVRVEHERHEVALLEPDAVLAAQHAAGGDARAHDRLAGGVHPLPDPGLARVEHEDRVQVAVAGVEDVHDDEVVLGRDLVDLAQHLDQPGAGHDRVVQVVVGRDAGDRAERRLAALPQQRPLAPASAATRTLRAPCARPTPVDDRDRGLDAGGQPVELDEQHRLGVARVAGADEVLDRAG